MSQPRARSATLDVARALAMVAIICGHFGIKTANRVVYTFHVPLFLCITGYLLSTRLPLGEFVRRRSRQMLVPYYVGCLLVLGGISAVCLVMGPEMGYDLGTWAKTTLFAALYASGMRHEPGPQPFVIPPIGLLWYLWGALWAMVVVRAALETKRPWLVVLLCAVAGWASGRVVWLPLSVQSGLMGSFYVYLGHLAGERRLLERPPKPFAVAASAVVWGFCVWRDYAPNLVDGAVGGQGLAIFGSVAGCYVVACAAGAIARHAPALARPLAWYGQLTLVAMLFHAVQDYAFPQWVFYDWVGSLGASTQVAHLLLVAVSVAWSALGAALVARVPALSKLLGVAAPRPYAESAEALAASAGASEGSE